MSVSKEDREAYERGLNDREKYEGSFLGGLLEPFLELPTALLSESEKAAYQKGREGKQLDKD